jgi:hypothetical protein
MSNSAAVRGFSDRILYQKLRLLSFAASLKPPRRQEATVRSANRRLPVNFKALIRRLTIGGHARQR